MLRGKYMLFVMLQKVAEVLQTFQNLYHDGITSETYFPLWTYLDFWSSSFQSCTLMFSVPVCVPGKRYNLADVSAAVCMSMGLIWFTLADSKVTPNFNVTGTFFQIQVDAVVTHGLFTCSGIHVLVCSVRVWRTGVILIILALCADAAIGNVQEKAMKLHNGSNSEMVLGSPTCKREMIKSVYD